MVHFNINNRKFRIYLAMFLALILVTQTQSIAPFVSRQNWKRLFAPLQRSSETGQLQDSIVFTEITPTPALSPFFTPTTPLPSTKKSLSMTKLPTSSLYPTAVLTITPTKMPLKVPIPTPTLKPTPAAGVSKSKLSVFMIRSYTDGAKKILEANPPLIKVIEPSSDSSFFDAIRAYKQRVPSGIAVVRFYEGTLGLYYNSSTDPSAAAEDFYNRVIGPGISKLGRNKNLFDYIQTPNEFENTPMWKGEADMKWNGRFWRRLVELASDAGMKMCIGGIPVGNIEAPELGFIIDDLRAMKQKGAAFCYHGYTFNYSKDISHEIYYSLRYRQYYDYFNSNAPDLASMPLILSEGGVVGEGDPYAGYQKYGGAEKYKDWLKWFDSELRKDSYVKGVTLFQIGNNSDWGAFNLEPISSWMANYLRSQH